MISLKLCRNALIRSLIALVIISSLVSPPAFSQETEDSQVFIAGFNAYQQKDYAAAIEKMNEVLQKYPDTPLRDMALFWLSRSHYKTGNQQDAAKFMSQFAKEYPDNPLKGTVEEELISLTARYDKGEKLPAGPSPAQVAEKKGAEQKAKAEQDRLAKAKVEEQRIAAAKAEQARAASAAAAAETARLAALKAEADRKAAEKVEQDRLAKAKAEEQRLAAAKAEQARTAAAASAAETARLAALKAEEDRKAAEKAEQDRLAKAKAEEQRLAAAKAEQARTAAAASAASAAETARLAALKAEEDRKAAEKAAAEAEINRQAAARAEQEKVAARKAEDERQARQRAADEKSRSEKSALREKAIAQYKSIIETYPGTRAASAAASKLKELGIAVALPATVAAVEPPAENTQILQLEVAQYAGFEFNLLPLQQSYEVAQRISVPFEITNRGNGSDSFSLETGFPTEFRASFAAAVAPDMPISSTPVLSPGETFRGVVTLAIPAASIDGLRITHPVKAASRFMAEATQSREVRLTASAPLLRALVRTDRNQPLPGDKIAYRVAVLNVGSTAAQDVTFRLAYPPQLEPVDIAAAGLRQEGKTALVLDGMTVRSGESKEFTVTFQLKEDSLAGQELLTRAELVNNPLKTSAVFVSNLSSVQVQRGILVRSGSERLTVIPGQTVSVPFVVTNTGNLREKFKIISSATAVQQAVVFNDLNRDGIRQASEPVITEIGPLAPKEEASVVIEVSTPRSAADQSQGGIEISFASESDPARHSSASARLIYSRPVLQMAMSAAAGRDGRLKPGEVAAFDLTISNKGSNLARVVELKSVWPEQLELVAADPVSSSVAGDGIVWKFKELGAGEKRTIKVSFRVKPETGVGTNIKVRNMLTYEDQLGNRY